MFHSLNFIRIELKTIVNLSIFVVCLSVALKANLLGAVFALENSVCALLSAIGT